MPSVLLFAMANSMALMTSLVLPWPCSSNTFNPISDTFCDYVLGGLAGNGVVWAIERVRLALFSEARFQFQNFVKGRPGNLFGSPDLTILERPWVGGTTGDLLTRMILDADLAGNWFGTILGGELVRLRPDWVEIVLTEQYDVDGRQVGWKKLGYFAARNLRSIPGSWCRGWG